ncbi:MAG: DUF6188 family protein [Thermoleophilia bacterium]
MEGRTVDACRFDFGLTLVVPDGVTESLAIRIEEPFHMVDGPTERHLDPGADPRAMHPALAVLRRRLTAVLIFKHGGLEISLDEGEVGLRVPASQHYEAWTITDTAGSVIASLPGGGVAFWRQADTADTAGA